MRKKRLRTIAAIVICLTVLFALWEIQRRGRLIQGRTLESWLASSSPDGWINPDGFADDVAQKRAEYVIRLHGTNVIPGLLRLATARDSKVKSMLLEVFPDSWRIRLGLLDEGDRQDLARTGFRILGPAAKSAIPELTNMLNSPDRELRSIAAEMIGSIGPPAHDCVPALLKRYELEDADNQRTIISALGSIHMHADLVVPFLVKTIERLETTKMERIAAMIAIGEFGHDARGAASVIRNVAQLGDPAERNYANETLLRISVVEGDGKKDR